MADQTTTPPLRLQAIIDAYSKLTNKEQITAFKKTLTPEELKDLEAYLATIPVAEKKPPPKPSPSRLEDFQKWSAGRTGLTKEELIKNFSDIQKLTPEDRKKLEEEIATKEEEARAAVEAKKLTPPTPAGPTVKPELIIKRTPYPKWWNDEGIAKIALSSPGSQMVITARGDFSLYIATIVLTVSGECDISFTFGSMGSTGSMNFGGENEPRGMVIATGNSPTPCGSGTFMITASSDDAQTIGGYVSYYLWKKETP